MTVSPVSNALAYPPSTQGQGGFRQDMQALQNALSSGDLAGAQQAFGQLKQAMQNYGSRHFQPGTELGPPTQQSPSPMQADIQKLQKALESGDVSAARHAFTQFKQDLHQVVQARQDQQTPPEPPTTGGSTVDVTA